MAGPGWIGGQSCQVAQLRAGWAACSYGAVYGTVAVVLGYLLHVPALGNLHWEAAHAWLGLQLAVPIILLGE